jgi:hypothetical protein
VSPTALSQGPRAWVRHMVPPLWGVPPIDSCDGVFLGEARRVTPVRTFIKLCTLGEGPRGHEASHQAAVLELVSDEVCVVWTGFLEDPLQVVCGWPCLMFVAMCSGQDAPHVGDAHLPDVAIIVVSCGRGPLKPLLAPLFAAHAALPRHCSGSPPSFPRPGEARPPHNWWHVGWH